MAFDVDAQSVPESLPVTTNSTTSRKKTKSPPNAPKKKVMDKPNTNKPTELPNLSIKTPKESKHNNKVAYPVTRGNRKLSNSNVPKHQTILTKRRTKRSVPDEGSVPGLCPRHHTNNGYKLEVLPKTTSRSYYHVNNLMCSGYLHMTTAKQKQQCCRNKDTDEQVHMCNKCVRLAATDPLRFFICQKCHDTYHSGIIKSFCLPSKRTRVPKIVNY